MGGLYGFEDLDEAMQLRHQQDPHIYKASSVVQPQTECVFPSRIQYKQEQPVSFIDYNMEERGKNLVINCAVHEVDGHNEVGEGIGTYWHRIRWTEEMVKLLISAVSYIRQFSLSNVGNGRNESSLLQKKIVNWKLVSKVMTKRGYNVSTQQCEDKFNNLKKNYKRLNDILGRGTSCKVVQNPKLLDEINISEETKENAKKMLSSKQLFYEEMSSYHNGNHLYLPHDPDLYRYLQLALRRKDVPCSKLFKAVDFDEQDQDAGADTQDNDTKDGNLIFMGYNGTIEDHPQLGHTDLDSVRTGDSSIDKLWNQWTEFKSCSLKLQKLQVKLQMLKIENQRFKWQRICRGKNREMMRMRMQNECLKIENERVAMELKYKEMRADCNLTV